MDAIHIQVQSLMANQSQIKTTEEPPKSQQMTTTTTTNNPVTDELIAREAGRGIDREGGNYQ